MSNTVAEWRPGALRRDESQEAATLQCSFSWVSLSLAGWQCSHPELPGAPSTQISVQRHFQHTEKPPATTDCMPGTAYSAGLLWAFSKNYWIAPWASCTCWTFYAVLSTIFLQKDDILNISLVVRHVLFNIHLGLRKKDWNNPLSFSILFLLWFYKATLELLHWHLILHGYS